MEYKVTPTKIPEGSGPLARIECISIVRHLSFCRGNAFKYVWRCGYRGGPDTAVQDLRKALWYLEDGCLNPSRAGGPVPEAVAVFSLIPRPEEANVFENLRYGALFDIADGGDPSGTIREMINRLMEEI